MSLTDKRFALRATENKKRCPRCQIWKDYSDFSRDDTKTKGMRAYCKPCEKIYHAEYGQKTKEKYYFQKLEKKLKISQQEFFSMNEQQNNSCAICGFVFNKDNRATKAQVDHSHETGKVRALLCHRCNNGLGCFGDDIVVMRKAIWYIEKHKSQLKRAA